MFTDIAYDLQKSVDQRQFNKADIAKNLKLMQMSSLTHL